MTFAPPRNQPIGKIADVLAQNIVQASDLKNDGDHKYSITEIPVSDPPLPMSSTSQYIYVPLTTSQVEVVEFQKSFIKLSMDVKVKPHDFEAKGADDNDGGIEFISYFIGLKHSSDLFGDYQIRYKGRPIAVQPNATIESFLYNSLKDESQTKYRPGNHSSSSAVEYTNGAEGYCGNFMPLNEIQGCTAPEDIVDVHLSMVIPFTDIQIFQQFDDFPNALFGDLEIGFKINPGAFVTKTLDPMLTYEHFLSNYPSNDYLEQVTSPYIKGDKEFDRSFVQMGDPFEGIVHAKVDDGAMKLKSKENVYFTIDNFEVTSCSAVISGYNVETGALERMRKTYEDKPWIVFTQSIDVRSFSLGPQRGRLDTTQQTRYTNTTDLIFLFPTTPNEVHGTVFKNPMLVNLHAYTMGNTYPQTPLRTRSAECTQLMLNSCLVKNTTPQKDFATSLIQDRWLTDGANSLGKYDDTTFLLDIKVERSSALGLMNDGIDSDGKNEVIRLVGMPEFSDDVDEYCHGEDIPPPILVTIGDAYWAFNSRNGGNCMISSQSFEKQIPVFMTS